MNVIILFLFLYGVVDYQILRNVTVFVLCDVVSTTPIATTNNNQRIIGGSDAKEGQFPYQVSIRVIPNGMHLAGGSIISNQWILTCAYCSADGAEYKIAVVVGSIFLNSGGVTHDVLLGIKHPDFDKDKYLNDIGLILVKGQIIFSDLVGSIKLSSQSSPTPLLLTVAGWGMAIIAENSTFPNTLQYVSLKSISNRECQGLSPRITVHYTQHICTYSSNGPRTCLFDNGSPLVNNGEQYGIVSYNVFCIVSSLNIHTKVSSFRDWIKEISNV